jgi:hypothetical protein
MIKLLRRGDYHYGRKGAAGWRDTIDRGEFLIGISPTNADYFVTAVPVGPDQPGLYYAHTDRAEQFYLQLRSPIPLFDPSSMGGRDAATTAAAPPPPNPTEELTNEPAYPTSAICDGG